MVIPNQDIVFPHIHTHTLITHLFTLLFHIYKQTKMLDKKRSSNLSRNQNFSKLLFESEIIITYYNNNNNENIFLLLIKPLRDSSFANHCKNMCSLVCLFVCVCVYVCMISTDRRLLKSQHLHD